MRRFVPALAIATAALVVACADATSPPAATRTPSAPSATIGHPPPPPLDTGSYAATPQGAFTLNTTYFLNPAGNNGWVHFPNQQPDGVTTSPDASIRYHMGEVSGKGTVTASVPGGIIIVDLSSVNGGKFNDSCTDGCAEIPFTGAFTAKGDTTSTPTAGTLLIGFAQPGTQGN